jgi:hypothetical protein
MVNSQIYEFVEPAAKNRKLIQSEKDNSIGNFQIILFEMD